MNPQPTRPILTVTGEACSGHAGRRRRRSDAGRRPPPVPGHPETTGRGRERPRAAAGPGCPPPAPRDGVAGRGDETQCSRSVSTGRGPGASTAGRRSSRPTRGTPMWSTQRRSPVPMIAAAEEHRGSHLPPGPIRRLADETRGSANRRPTSMHPYLLHEIARQHTEDLRRAARQHGSTAPAGPRSHRRDRLWRARRPRIAPAGAVSEHFGAGQLVLVAHAASSPPKAASSGPPGRTLPARRHGKKRNQA